MYTTYKNRYLVSREQMYKSDDKMVKYFCSSTKSLWVKKKKKKTP